MAKRAEAGEMRTRIYIMDYIPAPESGPGTSDEYDGDGYPISMRDEDGYEDKKYYNVLGEDRPYHCKWVSVHGAEAWTAHQASLKEPATLTMRYTSKLTPTSIIYRAGDDRPYEVISVNDVEDRHVFLEVKVQRMVKTI